MPRSSRHKSSKHSSKDAKEYSDSEKDSILKKPKEDSTRHGSRDTGSGEKRKYDAKAVENKEFVDFVEEFSGFSSKKRREKAGAERWIGESNETEQVKLEKDLKGLGDIKGRSSRWDDSPSVAGNINEEKRTGSKAESKPHRSERKERGDRDGLDRDKKSKDNPKSERILDAEVGAEFMGGDGSRKQLGEEHSSRNVAGNTGINEQGDLVNPEDERDVERRVRRKKNSSSDMDKYQDITKNKEDGDKEERHKDKYHDDAEKDYYLQEEKHSRHSRDHSSVRFDDKYSNSRIDKKDRDTPLKKSKAHDVDTESYRGRYHRRHDDRDRDERDHETDRDRDNDRERVRDLDRERGRDVDRDRGKDMDRERGRDRERDREKDGDRDRDRERYRRERELERDRTRDRDQDNDWEYGSYVDRRGSVYREDRSRRRSPDEFDDYLYNDRPKRVKSDADRDRERSITHRIHGRSPSISKSHAYSEKYRDNMLDDVKYGEPMEGTGLPGTPEKSSKYHYADKHAKLDDYRNGDPLAEKPSNLARIEKSPSNSIDHKHAGRSSRRRSIDVDEAERRSSGSNDVIEGSGNDDRQSRDMTSKRSIGEEYSPTESSFHHKPSHGNWSAGHGFLNYRAGVDSPFMGSMGEDSRGHSGRYRRSVDPNVGRHGNHWKGGVPHWPPPISNGFIHYPHGPPQQGTFPGMHHQYHPPIFGMRPPMDHAGIPYHLPDTDRFPGNIRPVGWQSIMEGGMVLPIPGWGDLNISSYHREEIPYYGPGGMSLSHGRPPIMEPRKQNVDIMTMEAITTAEKDVHMMKAPGDEAQTIECGQEPGNGEHEDMEKVNKRKISCRIIDKEESQEDRAKAATAGTPELAVVDNATSSLYAYLSKVDVSAQLTDPDLYSEYVNMDIYGLCDDIVEDEKEYMQVEDREALVSEILLKADACLELPVAEESIFQRAMDLYKSQSCVRETRVEDTEWVVSEVKMREEPVGNQNWESQESSGLIDVVHDEHEQMVAETGAKEMHVAFDSSKLLKVEPYDFNPTILAAELVSGNDGLGLLVVNNDTQMEIVGEMKGEEGENAEQTGVSAEVSDQLILSRGSSFNKVCEALVPPNESESVIITRIPENAPESTH